MLPKDQRSPLRRFLAQDDIGRECHLHQRKRLVRLVRYGNPVLVWSWNNESEIRAVASIWIEAMLSTMMLLQMIFGESVVYSVGDCDGLFCCD